ncbi:UDP-N-acetylmuramoyl-L-alanyl-D-glutamate--2,6-diaminopimelate ligase [Patescibacteria group bacterium]|nr:UDP-N-acetylmuramoyl-L-alanyl-D-glutamate--2,6-diaminopimelate ligase [Patescibacteria group bacterium]
MRLRHILSTILPRPVYRALLRPYHYLWAFGSALWYGFPARDMIIIGVTGTKGKSSVSEMIAAILEEDGHTVALSSTIRFKIGNESHPNLYKMTLPGRGFLQRFFREAKNAGCTHVVVELTSESTLQYRHLFTSLNVLVFTNLTREHIESHGSMENYFAAKYRIGKELASSEKRPRAIVANADDPYGIRFLELPVEESVPFSYGDAQNVVMEHESVRFTFNGATITSPHPGVFSIMNILAAVKAAMFLGASTTSCTRALQSLSRIPGRAEQIDEGQNFLAVVDYAHTPDSLRALYDAYPARRKICVLGNTGGGRDTWKRPEMGKIAEEYCHEVILTNEDPYDEDPDAIVAAMADGMEKKPRIVMDRREAIRTALSLAAEDDVVLITGKGTDPYIMGAKDKKTPWSDAQVVHEELQRRAV